LADVPARGEDAPPDTEGSGKGWRRAGARDAGWRREGPAPQGAAWANARYGPPLCTDNASRVAAPVGAAGKRGPCPSWQRASCGAG